MTGWRGGEQQRAGVEEQSQRKQVEECRRVETEERMQGSTRGEHAETTGCRGDGVELQVAVNERVIR